MIKIKKLAFTSTKNDPTSADTAKTLALTSALTEVGSQALRAINSTANAITPQDTPIGELFSDFVNTRLKPIRGRTSIHIPSDPRIVGAPGSIWNYLTPPPAFLDSPLGGAKFDADDIAVVVDELKARLGLELSGSVPPDKLTKINAQGINGVSDMIKKWELDNLGYRVTSPRNNLPIMAHEYGHMMGLEEMQGVPGQSVRNKLREAGRKLWSILGESMSSSLPEIPVADKVYLKIRDKINSMNTSRLVKDTINQYAFAPSLPVMATGAVAASDNVRKVLKALSPIDAVDNAIDWVGEHPMASVGAASIPYVVNEMFTAAPGGKLLHEFFGELKNKGKSIMGHPLADDVIKGLTPHTGSKELLKLLGHTGVSAAAGAILPLSFIAASYLMNRGKNNE